MIKIRWLRALFEAIDSRNAEAFAQFLAPTCSFRFGNMPVVTGRSDIERAVASFFTSLNGVSHSLTAAWQPGDATICHGDVRYTRKDETTLVVPFANVLFGPPGAIYEYLIFADISEL